MLNVKRFNCVSDVSGFLPAWEKMSESNPFLSPVWLGAIEKVFSPDNIRIYVATDNADNLIAVLPLRIRKGGGLLLGMGDGHADYGGMLLGDVDNAGEIFGELMGVAFSDTGVPRMRLRNIRADSTGYTAIEKYFTATGTFYKSHIRAESYEVAVSPDFESVYSGLRSSKSRYNLRRSWKKLSEGGGLAFGLCVDGEIAGTLDFIYDRHRERWGEKSQFNDDSECVFVTELCRQMEPCGCLRLFALKRGEDIIAAAFGFQFGDVIYYYNIASRADGDFARFSPGSLLLREVLRFACESGCKVFDMLRGAEDYKKDWGGVAHPLITCEFYNARSVKGLALSLRARLQKAVHKE